MAKKFHYRGIPEEKLLEMSQEEFAKIAPARIKRTLKRGFNPFQKRLLERVKLVKAKGDTKPIKTNCGNMPILPEMVGIIIKVHNGKEYVPVQITAERVGHYLGEFVLTRKRITHNAPGVGATRSSKFIPLK